MTGQALADQLGAEISGNADYVAEGLSLEFAENVARILAARGISRSELAEAMGVSRAYVSRTLNAPPNLTLRTIAAFSIALGVEPCSLLPGGVGTGQRPRERTACDQPDPR